MNVFDTLLQKYRDVSFSERDKGYRFERLMQAFLKTYRLYDNEFRDVWLWPEFPSRKDFGGRDTGIDLVIRTKSGGYWAIQCKCYRADARIDKPMVDTFLSTSGKTFFDVDEPGKKVSFEYRLWIDTTLNGFNQEAENTIRSQTPPVGKLGYYDLALPASTDKKNIAKQFAHARLSQKKDGGLIVVFSTYQSIDVISAVQKSINRQNGDFVFDLIICDEAHRTTGVTLAGAEESAFVKVHDDTFLRSKKRMYMTATPRIYAEAAQKKAKEAEAELCSMDDAVMYGEEMYRIGFGEAVDKKLLSDYKVIVLTIAENQLSGELKSAVENRNDKNEEIKTEDTLKIIGCINALSKKSLTDQTLFEGVDPAPMRSAVAFCQNIAVSKATAEAFNVCREAYFATMSDEKKAGIVTAEAGHVDGTMGAQVREGKLAWLKSADSAKNECRILNNVRCLSEGVDVPSLDAVMFLSARNSQIDVVQSVGRVMRAAPGKKYGYIIIPVVVLPEAEPEKILAGDRFVEDVLQKEFGRSMSDENVHILDPFTGTGTFITRLLQSGIVKPQDLERKYAYELHANEIVLLAYYIASINIENVYHDLLKINEPYNTVFYADYEDTEQYVADSAQVIGFSRKRKSKKKGREYTAFPGICLTDTFQLGETEEGENLFSEIFPQNSERVLEQKKTPLRVIMGNPPYSVGQKSANDNAQNQPYPKLEARIAETYAASSTATNKNSLYDTYIKAFRWSTDRLDPENGGIIAFITNSGWLEKGASDGIRKCLQKEFSSIYVLNLRGAIRGKSGEAAKREGQNVFDIMTGVAITLLIKTKTIKEKADIYYRDIGQYFPRKEKFSFLTNTKSIFNIKDEMILVKPDKHNDWLSLRNDTFSSYISIGDKEDKLGNTYFIPYYSNGIKTARDHFCWNYSEKKLEKNIKTIISFYNQQCKDYHKLKENNDKLTVENFVDYDSTKITWNRGFKQDIEKGTVFKFNRENIYEGFHRPFCKQYLYFAKELNDMTYQMPKLFPTNSIKNILICVSGINTRLDNTSVFITDNITDLNILDSGTQCFPLYWYEKKEKVQGGLFEKVEDDYIRHDAVSDFILDQSHTRYGLRVTKEDIFYYVYGLLHSPGYRKTFANDLKKMLPRLPLVEKPADFWAFSQAGRQLAALHLNYEDQKKPAEVTVTGLEHKSFTVTKMSFPVKGKTDTITYNPYITISNIPEKAYEYIVNGKSAIEWIMERYAVTTHKESGIKNDPNDWAIEHNNPRYILELLLSVITVSIKTVDIVAGLPKVEWR